MKPAWSYDRRAPRSSTRALLLGATLLACAFRAQAAVPEWLRATARAPLPSYPDDTSAVVLLNEQITTVNDNGEIKTLYREAFKILRPEGRQHGTVGVYFDNETRLTYLKAWSLPAKGGEYEVKEKDAIEASLPGAGVLYQDTRYKVLKIPAAEPGNVVGYEYEQKRRPFVLQDAWLFQSDIPVRRARFALRLPKGWEFRTYWLNHAVQAPRSEGENQSAWELENLPAVEPEPRMPPWRAVAGRMAVTYYPRHRDPGEQSLGSWQEIGRWYAQLAAERRHASPEIRQKAADLTTGAKTPRDKIRALASFVQKDIRYVAIEIGIGGYQPHAATSIFANRYGDCKDKATLLSTMLHEVGIASDYVLVNASRGVVDPEFPSMLGFNHVIVAIHLPAEVSTESGLYTVADHPRLGRLLFFDPTDPFDPLGYLPESLQSNYGLLVTEDGGELVKLPLLSPSLNRLLRAATLKLAADGTLYGEVEEIRWGGPATELRAQLLSVPEAERKRVLESFLGIFLGGFTLKQSEVENLEKFDQTLVVHYGFVAPNYAKAAGDLLLVRPRVLGQKSEDVLERKERKYPVEFPATTLQSDSVEIALPKGYKVDELPPPVEVDIGTALYRSKAEVAGDVLRYRRQYQIKDVLVPVDHLDGLKKFFREVATDERASAVLKKGADQ